MTNYQSLSDKELLQMIVRVKEDVIDKLLTEFSSLSEVFIHSELRELTNVKGIGIQAAMQVKAICELSRRLYQSTQSNISSINSPADVSKLLMAEMRYLKQEEFRVVLLDAKNRVVCIEMISRGSFNSSIVEPSDCFRKAIKLGCAAVILTHQHPSGNPAPSKDDVAITTRLVKAGKIMGINVLDHVIIGAGKYISLKEKGLI